MSDFRKRIGEVCAVAAACADDVDTKARFPLEAIEALQSRSALGALVPKTLGGEGFSLSTIADACYALSGACGSAGLIFAMHCLQVQCLIRHAELSAWHANLLREISDLQLLMASSTSEGPQGGSIRGSEAAVEIRSPKYSLTKHATTISYAKNADCILATARRAPDASASDQVVIAIRASEYSLEELSDWNTLGMRGTCSGGYRLQATFCDTQILPAPFDAIHTQTMLPVAHMLWASVWAGIAADAIRRAKDVRKRRSDARADWGLIPLAQAATILNGIRAEVVLALSAYERASNHTLESFAYRTKINAMKISVSTRAVEATLLALQAAGLSGYRNNTPQSLARHVRDICSAPIMISNARILETVGALSMISDDLLTLGAGDSAQPICSQLADYHAL